MCAIFGAVVRATNPDDRDAVNRILEHIWLKSRERGRDGAGWLSNDPANFTLHRGAGRDVAQDTSVPFIKMTTGSTLIGNLRAEPTTEFVSDKAEQDQQPYSAGAWSIAHNGTIANDKALRTHEVPTHIDSAAIAEHLDVLSARVSTHDNFETFEHAVSDLKGSFAILATHAKQPGRLYVAANYRPVWYAKTKHGIFFASARHYFPDDMVPQMLQPYTAAEFDTFGMLSSRTLHKLSYTRKALVVCSGGMDSVVAATYAQRTLGADIHLIHFLYGSRAEGPEVTAIKAVAEALGAPLTLFPLNVYSKGDSPLLDPDAAVAGGEAGAEFAHEWVPARNLVLLSVATAFAEARGIETIVLGNNLEEAGAYPDNEPEFIARFNDMLPFAVGDGKQMRVIMPVGNMMKHEIVALGHKVGAPLHLTWSCYRAGEHHCGKCGPCYMRRKAFDINGLDEVIDYAG